MKKLIVTVAVGLFPSAVAASTGSGAGPDMTHRMMMLAIQLGVILFAARIGNIVFEKIRMPGVLGELSAGILIGPFLFGAIGLPGFPAGIFPVQPEFPITPELYGLCSLAAVVLLFMVGLETDLELFLKYSVAGTLVGIGGVVFSFILGDLTAVLFSPLLFGRTLGFMAPPCLFLGILSTATSVGITARILSEKKKLDSPEGVTILAGAVIDDVLGIILLAIGLGVISASQAAGGVDWVRIGAIAAKAVGIWLSASIIGLLVSRKISTLLKWFKKPISIAILALGLALILAGLFEQAGLAMIIGAYVMGLSLSRTDVAQIVREKLDPIYALLVPVFFTVMGMLVDVRLLASGKVLGFGLVFTAVAILAKIGGCGLPALLSNFNARGALRIGVGMLPRGEVALIIAGIGLSAGIMSKEVFGVGVLMTLITTVVAPPILVVLFGNSGEGLRRPVAKEASRPLVFRFPSFYAAELISRKILEVFESEGFFVHVLSRSQRLYQLRKDHAIIGFQQKEREIEFQCSPSETALINTAMVVVLQEFEQMIRELKKQPVNRKEIGKWMQEPAAGSTKDPDMGKCIGLDNLEPELTGRTKWEVIDELLKNLHHDGKIRDLDEAREAVLVREESMSTGMQYGVAIPHGRTDAVDRLVCAVGISRGGVDFGSLDGKPARIVVLTLSPKSIMAPHVQFMSTISQVLNEEGRRILLGSKTAEEMYTVLTGDRRGLEKLAVYCSA